MDIETQLVAVADNLNCQFVMRGQPIATNKVFAIDGLLPAIMRRADQLASFCLGYGLGVTFEDAPGTMLGTKVTFDDQTPVSLRLLCALDILIEIIQSAPSRDKIPVDDLAMD